MKRTLTVAALMLLSGLAGVAPVASAAYVVYSGQMPADQHDTPTIWTGTHLYSFGGWNGMNQNYQIVRFDPANDDVSVLASTVPANLQSFSVAWNGTHAFLFGGWNGAPVNTIRRWDPGTGAWQTLGSTLPSARNGAVAVTAGTHIYVFGGILESGTSDEVVRFTPSTGAVTVMTGKLSPARFDFSAVWTGTDVYLFGGVDAFGNYRNVIQRYTPATDTMTTLSAALPANRIATSAVWDGSYAYVSGGTGGGFLVDTTYRFDPATTTVTTLTVQLRTFRTGVQWVNGEAIYMGDSFGRILRFHPTLPQPPSQVTASPGPALGQVSLSWLEPVPNDGITNYRIYRGTSPTALAFVTEVGNVLAHTDTGLTPGTTYYYEVRSKNSAGEGPASPIGQARATQLPGAPGLLTVNAGPSRGALTLGWQSPADDGGRPITAYSIYRSGDGASFTYRANAGTGTSFTDSGLGDGETWHYRVSANTSAGEGPPSVAASGRTFYLPSEPENVQAEPGLLPNTIQVTWDPPADTGGTAPVGYHIYRGRESGDLVFLATVPAPVTSFTDDGRSPLIVEYYQVAAQNVVGVGPRSDETHDSASPWPFRPPAALPAGWTDQTLLHHAETLSTPPVSLPVLTIDGRPNPANPDIYDVTLTVAGTPLPTVGVNTLGLVTQPIHLELVDGPDPVATVEVLAVARADPTKQTCLLTVGGDCAAAVPATDPAWLASEGAGALLWIEVWARDPEGGLIVHNYVTVPLAGQVLG